MQKVLWVILLAAFTMLIFLSSSLPMSESGRLSSIAAAFLGQLLDIAGISVDGNLEHLIRKLAHFTAFAVQGGLLCRTFSEFRIANRSANGYVLFFGLLTAVADEYIQSFSAGRTSAVNDVLLDFSGTLSVWLAYRIWQWSRH